jgi:hypothetical protein
VSRHIDTATAVTCREVSSAKRNCVNFVGVVSGGEIVEPIIDLVFRREGGKEAVEVCPVGTGTGNVTIGRTLVEHVGISLSNGGLNKVHKDAIENEGQ